MPNSSLLRFYVLTTILTLHFPQKVYPVLNIFKYLKSSVVAFIIICIWHIPPSSCSKWLQHSFHPGVSTYLFLRHSLPLSPVLGVAVFWLLYVPHSWLTFMLMEYVFVFLLKGSIWKLYFLRLHFWRCIFLNSNIWLIAWLGIKF